MPAHITDRDFDILAHAYLQANSSIAAIGKQAGYQEHTVRSCLSRLQAQGIVTPVLIINPYILGFTEYYTFFAVENSAEACRKTITTLINTPEIFWVAETGAAYRFSASILARSPRDLARILDGIAVKLGNDLKERAVTICHSFYLIAPNPTKKRNLKVPQLWYGDSGVFCNVDATDHKILRCLSKDPLITTTSMAKMLGLPITTIDYRIKALRKNGAIVGYQFLPNFELIGWGQFPVALYLRRNTPEVQKKILKYASSAGMVSYLAFLIGRWDAELGVQVKHPSEISRILAELNDLLGADLNRIEVYPDFRYHKLEYYPFDKLD